MTKLGKLSVGVHFQEAEATIRRICEISGTPGLAIGVFDQDGKVLDRYHGQRDIMKGSSPDIDTLFNIGSMCKAFTALAVACLVADKKIRWDDRIDSVIEDLRATRNGEFTIRDLLSHRTGLCRSDALFIGSDNNLLLTKSEGNEVFACLDASRPPRQDFIYNNFGYHAVGRVIEEVSSMTYGEFLARRIFKPLNMNRTFTNMPSLSDENIAKAYIPYSDLRPRQVPPPRISSNTVAFAAGCIRSCLRDLIHFYSALLRNFFAGDVFEELRIKSSDLRVIFEATIPLKVPCTLREQSYAMGWARTQLPNQISELSGNSGLLEDYPTIGSAAHAPLTFHHSGNNLGCSSTVYMMPELRKGIVVLGNALGHCDATDWTAQVMTESYLYGHVGSLFCEYATQAALRGRSAMKHVQERLDREREPSHPPSSLEKYSGIFWHKSRQFRIVIAVCKSKAGDELRMFLQGRQDEMYTLHHYHRNTFVFNETFDAVVSRGQWCRPYWFYKIKFLSRNTECDALCWRIDATEERGQVFSKME